MSERSQLFILTVLAYLLLPFSRWRRRHASTGTPGILIVQTGKIGDLVCTTPIFRAIKKTWPEVDLGVAVTSLVAPLLAGNHSVDAVFALNGEPGLRGKLQLIRKIRRHGYHWVLVFTPAGIGVIIGVLAGIPNRAFTVITQLSRYGRSALIFANRYVPYELHASGVEHYCRMVNLVGPVDCREPRELFSDEASRVKAAQFLAAHGSEAEEFLVGISVAANKFNKQWPPGRFGELADRLIERYDARIIWIGASGDASIIAEAEAAMRRRGRAVSSAGVFTLAELAALLGRLKLFVSVDTGPLYMADAMGVPVVDIAGPADVRSQAPVGRALVIQAHGIPPRLTLMAAPDSPERDPAIMATTVEMVWEATRRFIEKHRLADARHG